MPIWFSVAQLTLILAALVHHNLMFPVVVVAFSVPQLVAAFSVPQLVLPIQTLVPIMPLAPTLLALVFLVPHNPLTAVLDFLPLAVPLISFQLLQLFLDLSAAMEAAPASLVPHNLSKKAC